MMGEPPFFHQTQPPAAPARRCSSDALNKEYKLHAGDASPSFCRCSIREYPCAVEHQHNAGSRFGFTRNVKAAIICRYYSAPRIQTKNGGVRSTAIGLEFQRKGDSPMPHNVKRKKKKSTILLYAASEIDSNMLYATNFFAPDPYTFIKTKQGKRIMVMSDLEIDRAKATSTAHRVLSLSHYQEQATLRMKGKTPHHADVISEVFKDLKIRSAVVPENFPASMADRLRKHGIHISIQPDPFFPERLYKTADEVKEIRKALKACEAGMQAAKDVLIKSKIRKGYVEYKGKRLTADFLRKCINSTVFDLGYLPSHTIVAPGKHGCDPHDEGHGPIRANSPIIIDIFPRSEKNGYFGDITRTFVKGKAPEKIAKMYRAVYEGQTGALRAIRDGVKAKDIHQTILDLFEKKGFATGQIDGRMQGFFHGTGHGLGLDIHEPPRIAINDVILKKGMVVTVEPGLYYYPIGGIRIEDTIAITKTGIKNLTRFSKTLEIP
jgi:Xaa-Pro aminopeptidase